MIRSSRFGGTRNVPNYFIVRVSGCLDIEITKVFELITSVTVSMTAAVLNPVYPLTLSGIQWNALYKEAQSCVMCKL